MMEWPVLALLGTCGASWLLCVVLLCLSWPQELHAIRQEACRIEGKADAALNKTVEVAADTALMLSKASRAVDRVGQTLEVEQERQAAELGKLSELVAKIDAYLSIVGGVGYQQTNPCPACTTEEQPYG